MVTSRRKASIDLKHLILKEGWAKLQVDCTNTFAQSEIGNTVFVEPSKFFGSKNGKYLVLKLLKSMYGLQQAPQTFFERLDFGL
jgi:hypothetical protein